jgi:hypothetical protein
VTIRWWRSCRAALKVEKLRAERRRRELTMTPAQADRLDRRLARAERRHARLIGRSYP